MCRGDAPRRIAGDSCARTTWENATLTAAWLGQHHPGAPVLLITDPWQLPRASRAFSRQDLQVQPLAAELPLSAPERNRLALREAAATLLYRLQGRMWGSAPPDAAVHQTGRPGVRMYYD